MTRRLNMVKDTSLVRGIVVNNYDPDNLGRVTVRIPSYHGIPDVSQSWIPDAQLPLCSPGLMIGAGNDVGQRIIPTTGTRVFVMFEEGDMSRPVYFGGIPLQIGEPKIYNQNDPTVLNGASQITTNDTMTDFANGHSQASQGFIFKSYKGSTFYFDDTDGHEVLKIIDQSGQMIKMESQEPVLTRRGNLENPVGQSRITVQHSDTMKLTVDRDDIYVYAGDTVLQVNETDGFVFTIPSDTVGD